MKTKESKANGSEASSYEVRDLVLGKLRGYPPWPGMVVDPDSVPPAVAEERPSGKKTKFYCVKFFPAADYAWVSPKDISKLQKHEIEAYVREPHRRDAKLMDGYKIALDPEAWEKQVEEEAEAAAAVAEDAQEDELEEEAGSESVPPSKSATKKRKRTAEPKEPKVKREKAAPKEKKEKGAAKEKAAPKKKEKKSKELAVESEDEAEAKPPTKKNKAKHDDDDDGQPEPSDPMSATVKQWRHRLQKGFLSREKKPVADDMPELDQLFTTIESHTMSSENLTYSKIGKVMRHIAKLSDQIPRDDEFKFRTRAGALVDTWGSATAKANGRVSAVDAGDLTMDIDKAAEADEAEAPATNGAAVDSDEKMADA